MNIACWSGPRNLSTALMYAFAARTDCDVVDEPYYAAYLAATGLHHPMRDAILAAQSTDPADIAQACAASALPGQITYQKHMTHHMLPQFSTEWFASARHVFLIRHPARVLASYARKRENPSLTDLGFVQQTGVFDTVTARGLPTIVIDSADIRQNPALALSAMCRALGIAWSDGMLSWPAGGHASDGVWARHWYDAVHRSTGFSGAEGPLPDLPASFLPLLKEAMPHYTHLHTQRLIV